MMLMIIIFALLLFTVFFRLNILYHAYITLERLPHFKDSLVSRKVIFFDSSNDMTILLFSHFFNPVLILIGLIVAFYYHKKEHKKKIIFGLILFSIIELVIRIPQYYQYIMFD